jgi:hypothetical protein
MNFYKANLDENRLRNHSNNINKINNSINSPINNIFIHKNYENFEHNGCIINKNI